MKHQIWKLLVDEDGQAMAEYVVLTGALILFLSVIWSLMQVPLREYYERIVTFVCLPIP